MAQVTNSTEPTGGVQRPMPRLRIRMAPNCTGSMPKAVTTGRKIGVVMMISGAMSHEAAEHEQDQVQQKEDDERVFRHRLHGGNHGSGYLKQSQQPGKRGRRADHHQHHGRGPHRSQRCLSEVFPAHRLVDEQRDDQRIDQRDAGALRRRENAGTDAAEDDGDQKDAGDGIQDDRADPVPAGEELGRVSATPGHPVGGDHQRRGQHQARYDAGG